MLLLCPISANLRPTTPSRNKVVINSNKYCSSSNKYCKLLDSANSVITHTLLFGTKSLGTSSNTD